MNGLYGYPTASSMLGHLGQTSSPIEVTITGILDGSVLDELKAAQSNYRDYAAQLDQAKAAIARMPAGPERTQAQQIEARGEQSLTQQFVSYRQARDLYNNFVTTMSTYSFGAYAPSMMSGMADLGQLQPIVIAIIGVAALAALASQLAGVISAMHGHEVATKGYIDQLAGLVHEIGGLPMAVGSGLQQVAIAAAIGLGVFVLFKLWKKHETGSVSVAEAA